MAIHTYVGARYIPRFMGTYDPTQIYDALDVVDNGSGTSYIARKTVPAGTPLTDTDHWFVYGASSGAIIALQNDMIQAQNDILAAQGDITSLQNEDTVIENKIHNRSRRIVTIADSYGEHPTVAQSWPAYLASLCDNISYQYDMHQNGMGWLRVSGGYNALSLFNANISSITDHDTITDVIICLGLNDASETQSDERAAVTNTLEAIHAALPNATIWCGYPEAGTHLTDVLLSNLINNIQAIEGVVSKYSFARWMSGLEHIMHDTALQEADGAHPNAGGSVEIAKGIACCINGGTYRYMLSTINIADFGNGDTSNVHFIMDGPITRVLVKLCNKTTGTIALTASNYVKVATLGSCRILNRYGLSVPCQVRDLDSSTLYPAFARTNGTDLEIALRAGTANIRPGFGDICLIYPTLDS